MPATSAHTRSRDAQALAPGALALQQSLAALAGVVKAARPVTTAAAAEAAQVLVQPRAAPQVQAGRPGD
jgi:hypothetical protein